MAEQKQDDTGRRDRAERKDASPAIRWDDAEARTISPTICTISATRKEFALLFGTKDFLRGFDQELTVHTAEKIVLNPVIAKRLAASLKEMLSQYELRFGPLEPSPESPLPEASDVPDKGRVLFDRVVGLGVETALEHSFKVCRGRFLENRFLLCISRMGQDEVLDEKVTQLCADLHMPESFIRVFSSQLRDANHIYFGFEEDGDRSLYKVYLEFLDRAEEKVRGTPPPPNPLLLHLGFKWDSSDGNRKTLTRYDWYHSLPFSEILERLPSMLPRRPGQDSLAVAEAVIGLASERVQSRDAQYVEVTEEGNARKSFDINLYKSGVRLGELKPYLMRLADYFDLDQQEFAVFCDGIASKRFGHLAGGTDREGRDFITIYYGVEYLQPATRHRRAERSPRARDGRREEGGYRNSGPETPEP